MWLLSVGLCLLLSVSAAKCDSVLLRVDLEDLNCPIVNCQEDPKNIETKGVIKDESFEVYMARHMTNDVWIKLFRDIINLREFVYKHKNKTQNVTHIDIEFLIKHDDKFVAEHLAPFMYNPELDKEQAFAKYMEKAMTSDYWRTLIHQILDNEIEIMLFAPIPVVPWPHVLFGEPLVPLMSGVDEFTFEEMMLKFLQEETPPTFQPISVAN
jgi:hypothetical protein